MERRFGQPVPDWKGAALPRAEVIEGTYATLERLDPDLHAAELHEAYSGDDGMWDYLGYGPFPSAASYHRWARDLAAHDDPYFFVIRDRATGHASGVASYLRIEPAQGAIELGHIALSASLRGTRAATEALTLMIRHAFSLGYRRVEWKCDSLNLPSRRAAQRLGFSYEGTFRQATVYKGRNRDTAWFAVIDGDYPALVAAWDAWLSSGNFDAEGHQIESLSDLTTLVRVTSDPWLSR